MPLSRRYARQIPLIGTDGQKQLQQSKVLVIGAGGLGCAVIAALSGAGIGHITLIDPDKITFTNLHRQPLYTPNTIGKYKVEIAKQWIETFNPEIQVKALPIALQPDNAIELFQSHDVIIDCTDQIAVRYWINDAAILCNKPWVYGALYRHQGQVAVFNYQGSATYRCLFPEPPENLPDCNTLGVLPTLPAIIGAMQAQETIKLLLNLPNLLINQLLIYDSLQQEWKKITIQPNYQLIQQIQQQKKIYNEHIPTCTITAITKTELFEGIAQQRFQIWDLRAQWEIQETPSYEDWHFVAPHEVIQRLKKLHPYDKPIVFVCAQGARSKAIALQLQSQSPVPLYYLNEPLD